MKMYIVKYSEGSYDDYIEVDIFVTNKKSKATKYVTKFNNLLKRVNKDFKKYLETDHGFEWMKKEFQDEHFERWDKFRSVNSCQWIEIEVR